MKKIIGVIGGMGPLATVNFFEKLVKMTKVDRDQDHPHILINNNPAVPDRTAAILENAPSPVPVIVESGRILEAAGASFLAIPCVTAHHFWQEIQDSLSIPLIHMIRETAAKYPAHDEKNPVGLLATSGTLKAQIFEKVFPRDSALRPVEDVQKNQVMRAIYSVKGGEVAAGKILIIEAAQTLIDRGAKAIIAGCTEIPLILQSEDIPVPLIDPVTVLAETCLDRVFSK